MDPNRRSQELHLLRLLRSKGPAPASPVGVIAIPARLASTRLPNKLLLRETGKPLLAHVIEQATAAVQMSEGLFREVVVAADDPSLLEVAAACGVQGVRTGDRHRCGTTRIAEAVETLRYGAEVEFVLNMQGDEPEIDPRALVRVAEVLLAEAHTEMATLSTPMPSGTEALKANPAAVKVVFDQMGRALYFSRAPIPFDRNPPPAGEPLWHLHLGIYAYRRSFLGEFARMPPSPLEERESLEQLRALDAGKTIRVGSVPWEWAGKGIDTPEDYAAFVRRHASRAAA